MKESQIREHLQKGWIRCIITFEVVGKPAKHVEESLIAYISNVKKDHRIIVLNEDRVPAEEVDDKLFSAFSEVEVLVKNLETLTWLSINFSPASIEILDPYEMVLPSRDVTNWLNDLLANLHEISTSMRANKNGMDHLTIAMNQLIQNSIILCLKQGGKTESQISQELGIYNEQIAPFLKHMVEKEKLAVENGIYNNSDIGALKAQAKRMMLNQPLQQTSQQQNKTKTNPTKTNSIKTNAKKKR